MATHKKGKAKKKSKGGTSAATDAKNKKSRREEEGAAAVGSPDEDVGERLTLEALDAISDESEEDDDDDGGVPVGVDGGEEDEEEWNAEAQALRRAIAEGAFDKLNLKKGGRKKKKTAVDGAGDEKGGGDVGDDDDDDEEEEEEIQEVALEDDSSSDEADASSSEEEEEGGARKRQRRAVASGAKALRIVTAELEAAKLGLPWAETFDMVPTTPLPFEKEGEDGGEPVDVHDDLKREVAFYNLALEAVHSARAKCKEAKVPFSRPDDFFAEMVKTDDHMAKVKDRLIFETKKMEAFEQRKANREHKLRAKEARAHKAVEKAKAKKEHFRAVDEWAKSAASGRGPGGRVRDNDDDYLERLKGGPSKKRQAADRKYGFGGKQGRFKQTDNKGLNDMSGYHSRGSAGKKAKVGAGANRKGKRARDAARARR